MVLCRVIIYYDVDIVDIRFLFVNKRTQCWCVVFVLRVQTVKQTCRSIFGHVIFSMNGFKI